MSRAACHPMVEGRLQRSMKPPPSLLRSQMRLRVTIIHALGGGKEKHDGSMSRCVCIGCGLQEWRVWLWILLRLRGDQGVPVDSAITLLGRRHCGIAASRLGAEERNRSLSVPNTWDGGTTARCFLNLEFEPVINQTPTKKDLSSTHDSLASRPVSAPPCSESNNGVAS